jgi:hypothetical protein
MNFVDATPPPGSLTAEVVLVTVVSLMKMLRARAKSSGMKGLIVRCLLRRMIFLQNSKTFSASVWDGATLRKFASTQDLTRQFLAVILVSTSALIAKQGRTSTACA